MKQKIKINKSELQGDFITPPEFQGQICETSYSCTENYIIEYWYDKSDDETETIAFHWPKKEMHFTPWNGKPLLGRRAGKAEIIDDVD